MSTDYTGALTLTWTMPTLGPGAVWQGQIVVNVTGIVGEMALAASSAEQSPVEMVIASPGMKYIYYFPISIS